MFRQLSDKDCAVTVLAHALGQPYTQIVNAFPVFRFMRSRPRIAREKADKIVGRIMRGYGIMDYPKRRGSYLESGRIIYNVKYRSMTHPYFSSFGLCDEDYLAFFDKLGLRYVKKTNCPVSVLRHVRFALLSVPSLNIKNSSHMVIWRGGRIWDPSPRKRYDFQQLRKVVPGIVAFAKDEAEYDTLRKRLRVNLTGRDIIGMLTYRAMLEVAKDGVDMEAATWAETAGQAVVKWFETSGIVPETFEKALFERFAVV